MTKIKNKNRKKNKSFIHFDKEKNIIRIISQYINSITSFKNLKGNFYFHIHNIIGFFIIFITIFNNSIYHLSIILLIISLDAFSIVVLHECPLTILERKYLGYSASDMKDNLLKSLNICYSCDHNYDKQIELLITMWTIVSIKILSILFFYTFNIKLTNYNNIYS